MGKHAVHRRSWARLPRSRIPHRNAAMRRMRSPSATLPNAALFESTMKNGEARVNSSNRPWGAYGPFGIAHFEAADLDRNKTPRFGGLPPRLRGGARGLFQGRPELNRSMFGGRMRHFFRNRTKASLIQPMKQFFQNRTDLNESSWPFHRFAGRPQGTFPLRTRGRFPRRALAFPRRTRGAFPRRMRGGFQRRAQAAFARRSPPAFPRRTAAAFPRQPPAEFSRRPLAMGTQQGLRPPRGLGRAAPFGLRQNSMMEFLQSYQINSTNKSNSSGGGFMV